MAQQATDPVKTLIDKAVAAEDAIKALQFSQAALNAANAMSTMQIVESQAKDRG